MVTTSVSDFDIGCWAASTLFTTNKWDISQPKVLKHAVLKEISLEETAASFMSILADITDLGGPMFWFTIRQNIHSRNDGSGLNIPVLNTDSWEDNRCILTQVIYHFISCIFKMFYSAFQQWLLRQYFLKFMNRKRREYRQYHQEAGTSRKVRYMRLQSCL